MDMKISSVYSAYDVYRADKTTTSAKAAKADGKKDEFALSSQARDYQIAAAAVANSPDIRSDLISQIKAKMDADQYNVSSGDVANKILENALFAL